MLNVEEMNLLEIFDIGSREKVIRDVQNALLSMDDEELHEILTQVEAKLQRMTDDEFNKIDFTVIKEDDAYGEQ